MEVNCPTLFRFFVNGVPVAVGAELFQFHPPCGIATIFLRGVARHPFGPFVNTSATFGAF